MRTGREAGRAVDPIGLEKIERAQLHETRQGPAAGDEPSERGQQEGGRQHDMPDAPAETGELVDRAVIDGADGAGALAGMAAWRTGIEIVITGISRPLHGGQKGA